MDTTEIYIKMCDCPEIQELWKPSIGDYMLRKYTVFGEPLDSQVWPGREQREEISILHYHTSIPQYWSAVTPEGEPRTVSFPDSSKMFKATSIWLPQQDQLQKMLNQPIGKIICTFGLWYSAMLEVATLSLNDILFFKTSMEQLWLAFVMREKYNKTWVDNKWAKMVPMWLQKYEKETDCWNESIHNSA